MVISIATVDLNCLRWFYFAVEVYRRETRSSKGASMLLALDLKVGMLQ